MSISSTEICLISPWQGAEHRWAISHKGNPRSEGNMVMLKNQNEWEQEDKAQEITKQNQEDGGFFIIQKHTLGLHNMETTQQGRNNPINQIKVKHRTGEHITVISKIRDWAETELGQNQAQIGQRIGKQRRGICDSCT